MKIIVTGILLLAAFLQSGFSQTHTNHVRWYDDAFLGVTALRDNHVIAPDNPRLQYWGMGYDYGRYILPSYLYGFQVTGDHSYLTRFTNRVNMLLDPTDYFRDFSLNALLVTNDITGANGHEDGYRGFQHGVVS